MTLTKNPDGTDEVELADVTGPPSVPHRIPVAIKKGARWSAAGAITPTDQTNPYADICSTRAPAAKCAS